MINLVTPFHNRVNQQYLVYMYVYVMKRKLESIHFLLRRNCLCEQPCQPLSRRNSCMVRNGMFPYINLMKPFCILMEMDRSTSLRHIIKVLFLQFSLHLFNILQNKCDSKNIYILKSFQII